MSQREDSQDTVDLGSTSSDFDDSEGAKWKRLISGLMDAYEKIRDDKLNVDNDSDCYSKNHIPDKLASGPKHSYAAVYRERRAGGRPSVRSKNAFDLDMRVKGGLEDILKVDGVHWFRIEKTNNHLHIRLNWNQPRFYRPKSIALRVPEMPAQVRGVTIWGAAHYWVAGIDEASGRGATLDMTPHYEVIAQSEGPSSGDDSFPSAPSGHNLDKWVDIVKQHSGFSFLSQDSMPSLARFGGPSQGPSSSREGTPSFSEPPQGRSSSQEEDSDSNLGAVGGAGSSNGKRKAADGGNGVAKKKK